MPEMTDPVVVASGSFITIDVIHGAEGTATVYQLPDDSRVLRFEDFRVTNGPDLHVILTKNPDPRDAAAVGTDYIDLGKLKGNVGSQNYDIPAGIDLNEYQAVVIYCVPFHVVFSTATL
ncbi:MAG: DM13 domain-containing protein [Anaerolineaceae bacterium]|nr:DM13 domain-containing protein [Anaerolineaceae bacterium]